MKPNILKEKNELIEENEILRRDNEYYKGKCDAYEYVFTKLNLFVKE